MKSPRWLASIRKADRARSRELMHSHGNPKRHLG
jgi:hypothetical protein